MLFTLRDLFSHQRLRTPDIDQFHDALAGAAGNTRRSVLFRKRPAKTPCKTAIFGDVHFDTVPLPAFCAGFTFFADSHRYSTAQELAVRL
jgi:hypothetical protein